MRVVQPRQMRSAQMGVGFTPDPPRVSSSCTSTGGLSPNFLARSHLHVCQWETVCELRPKPCAQLNAKRANVNVCTQASPPSQHSPLKACETDAWPKLGAEVKGAQCALLR